MSPWDYANHTGLGIDIKKNIRYAKEEKLANLNQIYLLGNLTRDPELRYTNEGMAITEMGMAVNKRWKDANGDESSVVDFFNITVWNHLAENCAGSLKKGDRIMIGGHLNLRSWENKDGKKFNIVNITADVAALSLEFSKANNHESRPAIENNHESRTEKVSSSANGPETIKDHYGRPEKINGSENRADAVNGSENRAETIKNHESVPEKDNNSESGPDGINGDGNRADKSDSGRDKPDGKIKKKNQEKKQDSISSARDLAADYALEVVST